MLKPLHFTLPLLLAALFLAGCPKPQNPTPSDTVMGSDTFMGSDTAMSSYTTDSSSDYDIVWNTGNIGDYSEDFDGLEIRDTTGANFYNGRERMKGVLPSIYFGFDQSSIATSERAKLQQAADYLMRNPTDGLLVEGHCDWYGTSEYNLALGDRRSRSARDYLITLGVSDSRIEVLSKGSLESSSGLAKSESKKDRRADLVILK